MRWSRRLLAVFVGIALLAGLFAAPGLAQTGGDTGDIPMEVPDEYTNGSGEGGDGGTGAGDGAGTSGGASGGEGAGASGGGSGGGVGGGGGNGGEAGSGSGGAAGSGGGNGATPQVGATDAIGGGMSTAGDLFDGGAEWFVDASTNFIMWMLTNTLELVIGTPTPENAGWLGIFGSPTNYPFDVLYGDIIEAIVFPMTLSFLALAVLINGSLMPFSSLISKYHTSKWAVLGFAAVFALALSWPMVTAMHALSDAGATTVAPSPEELLGTEEGIETLLTGLGTTGAAIYLSGGLNMLVYGLIYGMRYFLLLMVMPYVFGGALTVSIFAPTQRLRSFGSGIIGLHIGLLVMNWPMALLFRAAYIIGWDFGLEGVANVLLMVGAFVAGVAIPVFIAYQMTRLAITVRASVRGAGQSLSSRESYTPKTAQRAKQGVSRARDMGRSARERAPTAAQTVKSKIPMVSARSEPIHEDWNGSASARAATNRSTGTTQASRKRSHAADRSYGYE